MIISNILYYDIVNTMTFALRCETKAPNLEVYLTELRGSQISLLKM